MKKIFVGILLLVGIGILSGCVVTENFDEYERKQFYSKDEISEVIVKDNSTNYTIQMADTEEVQVEYSDSPAQSWYDIDVVDEILKIEKTQGTVGVEENSVFITLPEKEYQNITIETSNGDINFKNVFFHKYKCFLENGDITGTLNGRESDYHIVVKTKNGDSDLMDNVIESSDVIEFNVKNGNVRVGFME